MELLTRNWDLSKQLRMPAISRLQKMHNVDLALQALRSRGVSLLDEQGKPERPLPEGPGLSPPPRPGAHGVSRRRKRDPGQGHRGQAPGEDARAAVENGPGFPGSAAFRQLGA